MHIFTDLETHLGLGPELWLQLLKLFPDLLLCFISPARGTWSAAWERILLGTDTSKPPTSWKLVKGKCGHCFFPHNYSSSLFSFTLWPPFLPVSSVDPQRHGSSSSSMEAIHSHWLLHYSTQLSNPVCLSSTKHWQSLSQRRKSGTMESTGIHGLQSP